MNKHFKLQIYLSDESDPVQGANKIKKFTANYRIFISYSPFPLIMFKSLFYCRKLNDNINPIKKFYFFIILHKISF